MAKVNVYNLDGAVVGDLELSDAIFGLENVSESAVHQVVKAILANKRQGTASTKTRSEVRGGGRKPYRQKGTGRARQGSIRAAQWVGGGIIFGPQPRSYRQHVNKKVRRLAMKSVFTSKVSEGQLFVMENLDLPEIKTKAMVALIQKLPVEQSVLFVDVDSNKNLYYSTKNIPAVQARPVQELNVYEMLKYNSLVLTKAAVAKIEEVFA